MLNEWEDYFEILQVHFTAEPDIIKSAYIKLTKKYHPDINKSLDAKEKMQKINRAYAVLSNPNLRSQYTVKWMNDYSNVQNIGATNNNKIHKLDFAVAPCKKVLLTYLKAISTKKYEVAFDFLSSKDKSNITKGDFIKWQSLVGEIFELNKYTCSLKHLHKNVKIDNNTANLIVELEVQVVEKNLIMDRMEHDVFSKNIVYEKDGWRVFLGYTEVDSLVEKFTELVNLKKSKTKKSIGIIEKLMQNFSDKYDYKNTFITIGEKEQMRYNRYGNKFSIVQCKVFNEDREIFLKKNIIKKIEEILASNTINLDTMCRWSENRFLVLLPETDGTSANIVAKKLNLVLREAFTNFTFRFFVKEQSGESFYDLINSIIEQ